MNKTIGNKKIVLLIILCAAILGMSVGGTVAFLATQTDGLENTFTIGSVETEVTEEHFELKDGSDTKIWKDPKITNVGKNDCYVRARINISPSDADITIGTLGKDWVDGGDDFYYYTKAVKVGESTESIFDEVIIPDGWVKKGKATGSFREFDVIVYQEAVTANLSGETDYKTIWNEYTK